MTQSDIGAGYCVIVPAYREQKRVRASVEGIRRHCDRVVVIDDGSTDDTAGEARKAGAEVLRHETNQGKGAAIDTGMKYAREHGYEFVVAMDADGQHAPEDLPRFVEEYRRTRAPVILGTRMDHPAGMPVVRRLTNRFMSWLLSREMGQRVPDTQCGFRLYRCEGFPEVSRESRRFDYDSEILLLYADMGARIGAVPIRVIYGDEKSKIHPVRDTLRFVRMLRAHRRVKERRAAGGAAG
jgi:glycosyltransferase involved in cell wall biosynthesis